MNQTTKRRLAAGLAALALGLTGCGGAGSASQPPAPTGTPAASMAAPDGTRTGLGLDVTISSQGQSGKTVVTAAGVLLDPEGRILCCVIDAAENTVSLRADGTLEVPVPEATRWEMREAYGLKNASGIGREWYEQCQAFCDYVQGMTAEELAGVETDDGYAADLDLASGCTIQVTPFLRAVEKAVENAAPKGAGAGDTLRLGTVVSADSTDASAGRPAAAQLAHTFVLLTQNGDGRVTGGILDEVEPALTAETEGTLTADAQSLSSKLEKGVSYGMKDASGIGKEWYEQSEAFCEYLKGKTAGEIRAIPSIGADADLAAVCTVALTDILAAAAKAAG